MSAIPVMHVIDTLDAGGAERVAVNLVNALPRDRYQPVLCVTRRGGPLEPLVAADVERLSLHRRGRFDAAAVLAVRRYIRHHGVRLVHAHASSVFIGQLASVLTREAHVIWHDHFGRPLSHRSAWLYRLATRRISGVIAVSEELAAWARRSLGVPSDSVYYVPNFVTPHSASGARTELPGTPGSRIVCVANLRFQKNHLLLLTAMPAVIRQFPDAHLLLVGGHGERLCVDAIQRQIETLSLARHVSLLGHRDDVPDVLANCDVAVLSSRSEAFPLALLEYGAAGLACIATRTGQCAELLDDGRAGLLVAPGDAGAFADALTRLLADPALRRDLGERVRSRIESLYAPAAVMGRICAVYDRVLAA